MEASEYCFLVTTSAPGVDARLMQPFAPDEDLTVRFGTSPRTRKAQEIQDDGRVVLAYSDSTEMAYVVLKGTAAVERDIEQRRRYWREEWRDLFAEGPEGGDYAIIRFVPERVELMNLSREVAPAPYGLRPAALARAGDTWSIAEDRDPKE